MQQLFGGQLAWWEMSCIARTLAHLSTSELGFLRESTKDGEGREAIAGSDCVESAVWRPWLGRIYVAKVHS